MTSLHKLEILMRTAAEGGYTSLDTYEHLHRGDREALLSLGYYVTDECSYNFDEVLWDPGLIREATREIIGVTNAKDRYSQTAEITLVYPSFPTPALLRATYSVVSDTDVSGCSSLINNAVMEGKTQVKAGVFPGAKVLIESHGYAYSEGIISWDSPKPAKVEKQRLLTAEEASYLSKEVQEIRDVHLYLADSMKVWKAIKDAAGAHMESCVVAGVPHRLILSELRKLGYTVTEKENETEIAW